MIRLPADASRATLVVRPLFFLRPIMPTAFRCPGIVRLFVVLVLGFIALPAPARAADDPAAARKSALAAIRAAASGRDLAGLKEKLADAEKLKGEAKYDEEFERLKELCDYLDQFWRAIDKSARALQGAAELEIGDLRVAVVEFDGGSLTLRVSGENRKYEIDSVPRKLCLFLAEQVLKPDAPSNKVFFGSFLLLDKDGDRKLARQYFDEAAKAKVKVAHLLPEFGVAAVTPAEPIEIPTLTAAQRPALSDKSWQLREKTDKGWVKSSLEKTLTQNAEGRLEVKIPSSGSAEHYQVTPRRALSGNFGCRIILQNVKADQTAGLVSAESADEGLTIQLPEGTVMVEIGRQAGTLKCRINGQDAELTAHGKATPKLNGFVALTAPRGTEFTIASIEWAGR